MRLISVLFLVSLCSVPALAAEGGARGALREACSADVAALCPGVQPGGGRIRACLKANREKVSQGCKSAIAAAMQARQAAKAQQPTAPATQSAPPGMGPVVP